MPRSPSEHLSQPDGHRRHDTPADVECLPRRCPHRQSTASDLSAHNQSQGLNHVSQRMTRRTLLGAAGAATAATALPLVPGFSGLLPQESAADTQTNLSRMVDMRFGMFNHFSRGTFTNQERAEPNQSSTLFAPPSVNCGQWADAAAAAKMSYGILTNQAPRRLRRGSAGRRSLEGLRQPRPGRTRRRHGAGRASTATGGRAPGPGRPGPGSGAGPAGAGRGAYAGRSDEAADVDDEVVAPPRGRTRRPGQENGPRHRRGPAEGGRVQPARQRAGAGRCHDPSTSIRSNEV